MTATPTLVLATVFKAASDPVRVDLLAVLAHGEQCVCHLHGLLDLPQPTVSRHLAVLRHAGLVVARRDGSWVHYSLTPLAETWLAPALAQARADDALRARVLRLTTCPIGSPG